MRINQVYINNDSTKVQSSITTTNSDAKLGVISSLKSGSTQNTKSLDHWSCMKLLSKQILDVDKT